MYTYSDIGSRYVSFYIHRYVYIEYICMQHAVQRLENDSMNTPHTRKRASERALFLILQSVHSHEIQH